MGYFETLFAPRFFLSLMLVALLHPAVLLLADRLEYQVRQLPVAHALTEYVARPIFYAWLVVLFLVSAYPALYGFNEAPPFTALLAASGRDFGNLINLLFLLGLLLPALPLLGRYRGSVNAVQIMIVSALLFSWVALASKAQPPLRFWPSTALLVQLLTMSVLFHRLAVHLAGFFGEKLDDAWCLHGSALLLEPMFDFFLQGAVVLRYTLFLGEQVAG